MAIITDPNAVGATFAEKATQAGYRIQTPDEARRWVQEMVDELPDARERIMRGNANEKGGAERAKRASWAFLQKVGAAQGTITALHRTGQIPDAMADELLLRCLASLVTKTTDVVIPFPGARP